MTDISVEIVAYGTPLYDAVTDLRRAILRAPLGLDFTPEELASEIADVHFAALAGGEVVGTLLLHPINRTTVQLKRMAVAERAQKQGIGRVLVLAAENYARKNNVQTITMHARETARGFYESLGYVIDGDPFDEQNIPHIVMFKTI